MLSRLAIAFVLMLATAGTFARADDAPATTQPSNDVAVLELRANQAFNRGEYAIAMPLLQKLSAQLKDEPVVHLRADLPGERWSLLYPLHPIPAQGKRAGTLYLY